MEQYTPAEQYQLKLIYAAVYCALGFIDTDVSELQKSIQAGVRSLSFQVAIAGHGGSGSVKYGDRYPPLSKCISAFKSNINGMNMEDVRRYWRWIGRDSHDKLIRKYTRQFGSTIKICSCIGYSIKWQLNYSGAELLARGDRYYVDKEPIFLKQFELAKIMIIGVDKDNRPLILLKAKNHFPKDQDKEIVRRLDLLCAETIMVIANHLEGSTVIHDLSGLTPKNRDASLVKFGMTNFTRLFPGCFSKYFLHNSPNFYKMGFKMISPALDATLKSRVKFTTTTEELLEHIDLDQLPRDLGGTNRVDTIGYVPPRAEDDELMQDTDTRDNLQAERTKLQDKFQEGIAKWICGENFPERFEILADIRANYVALDPYVRSKTVWDRQGIIKQCRPDLGLDGPPSPIIPFDAPDETGSVSSLTPPSLNEAESIKMPPPLEEQQTNFHDQGGVLFDQEAVFDHLQMLEREHYQYSDESPDQFQEPDISYPVYQDPVPKRDYTYEYQPKPTSIEIPLRTMPSTTMTVTPQEGYNYGILPVDQQYGTGYTSQPSQSQLQQYTQMSPPGLLPHSGGVISSVPPMPVPVTIGPHSGGIGISASGPASGSSAFSQATHSSSPTGSMHGVQSYSQNMVPTPAMASAHPKLASSINTGIPGLGRPNSSGQPPQHQHQQLQPQSQQVHQQSHPTYEVYYSPSQIKPRSEPSALRHQSIGQTAPQQYETEFVDAPDNMQYQYGILGGIPDASFDPKYGIPPDSSQQDYHQQQQPCHEPGYQQQYQQQGGTNAPNYWNI